MSRNLDERRDQHLESRRRTHRTRTVAFQRSGSSEVALVATKGRQTFTLVDSEGFQTQVESHDWLVTAADLVIDGSPATPRRGDRIVETLGTLRFIYEVLAMDGVPEWAWSDDLKQTYRIHTKLVSTSQA